MLREMKSVSIIFIFIFFPHESLNFGIVFKIRILFVIVDGSLRVVFFFFFVSVSMILKIRSKGV